VLLWRYPTYSQESYTPHQCVSLQGSSLMHFAVPTLFDLPVFDMCLFQRQYISLSLSLRAQSGTCPCLRLAILFSLNWRRVTTCCHETSANCSGYRSIESNTLPIQQSFQVCTADYRTIQNRKTVCWCFNNNDTDSYQYD